MREFASLLYCCICIFSFPADTTTYHISSYTTMTSVVECEGADVIYVSCIFTNRKAASTNTSRLITCIVYKQHQNDHYVKYQYL